MTDKLQKRHGTALITWITRHILTADIPDDAGLGTGQATRLQVASRMLIAFTLHLNNQPITCTAIVDGGGGSETKVNYTLAYLSRLKILTATAKLATWTRAMALVTALLAVATVAVLIVDAF